MFNIKFIFGFIAFAPFQNISKGPYRFPYYAPIKMNYLEGVDRCDFLRSTVFTSDSFAHVFLRNFGFYYLYFTALKIMFAAFYRIGMKCE